MMVFCMVAFCASAYTEYTLNKVYYHKTDGVVDAVLTLRRNGTFTVLYEGENGEDAQVNGTYIIKVTEYGRDYSVKFTIPNSWGAEDFSGHLFKPTENDYSVLRIFNEQWKAE